MQKPRNLYDEHKINYKRGTTATVQTRKQREGYNWQKTQFKNDLAKHANQQEQENRTNVKQL